MWRATYPFAGGLYVFRGGRGNLVKILWHDGLDMSLYAKLTTKVHRLGHNQNFDAGWCRNHVTAFATRSTSRSQPRSTPRAARTIAPPISINTAAEPDMAGGVAALPAATSVITGTNRSAASEGNVSKSVRAALRQPQVLRRNETTAPGAKDCAQSFLWPRHSSAAGAPAPVRRSTRFAAAIVPIICSTMYATPIENWGHIVSSPQNSMWDQIAAYELRVCGLFSQPSFELPALKRTYPTNCLNLARCGGREYAQKRICTKCDIKLITMRPHRALWQSNM